MDKNFSNRYANLIIIKEEILKTLGENISSAIAYGSTISEDFYDHSDYDILLFLKDGSLEYLNKIRELREKLMKQGIKIDFNVHTINEVPAERKECFWHNNRSLYFQKEITLYGLVLIGESPFLHNNFEKSELQKEGIRVVNSLLYQARKMLMNRELNQQEKINLMKWCIYSVLYALSSKGIITKTKTEALEIFQNYFSIDIEPIIFLRAKQENNVPEELIQKAYKFLELLDKCLFEEYKNGRK